VTVNLKGKKHVMQPTTNARDAFNEP